MTEFVKMGIMYLVLVSTFIYANGYHNRILKFLSKSKKQYMKVASAGVGL